jgi:hypothetical protein
MVGVSQIFTESGLPAATETFLTHGSGGARRLNSRSYGAAGKKDFLANSL